MNISRWPKPDTRWYLGVPCKKCRLPILFVLDRTEEAEKRQPLSARKLVLTCPLDNCRHQADYTGAAVPRFKKQQVKPNEPAKGKMKAPKTENPTAELKIWCESCCLRVAPNEERTLVRGKTYHSRCYSKLNSKQQDDAGLQR